MAQAHEDYCRKLETRAAALALADEAHLAREHLDAFNFGRIVGRMETAGDRPGTASPLDPTARGGGPHGGCRVRSDFFDRTHPAVC
jgi:hypothetical protein